MRVVISVLLLASALSLTACGQADRKQAYFDRGVELMQQGDYVHAKLELKNALQIDAKDASAWYWLGEAEAAQKNWKNAFGAYSKAAQLDPANIQARAKRAKLLLDANQRDDAQTDIDAILKAEPQNADGLALRGALEARNGDMDAAAKDAKAALASDPGHADAILLLAAVQRERGKLSESRRLLETGIQAHPQDQRMRLSLAAVCQELGDVPAAREQLERLVEMEPGQLEHVARLAGFLTKAGDEDAARKVLRAAVAANPDRVDAKLLLVQWTAQQQGADAAIELLQQLIADHPDTEQLRFALAELDRKSGKTDEAVAVYRTIIERKGVELEGLAARNQLASLLLSQKRLDDAAALVAEVLGESPRDTDALQTRAVIELMRKQPDKAIADLRDVLQYSPSSVRALILLAKAHAMNKEVALAQDALEKAVDAAPSEPQAYLELAQLKVETGDMQGASHTLERFLERVPDNAEVQSALARIQLSQQDWTAIETTADRILAARPNHPLGYYLKGLVLQRNGKYAESIEQFETALEKRPDAVDPLLGITRSYMALKQPEQAEARLRKLLAEQPANAAGLSLLAEVYLSTQRFADARAQLEQLIALYPKSPMPYAKLADLRRVTGDKDGGIATLQAGVKATSRNAYLVFRLGMALQDAGRNQEAIDAYDEVLKSNPQADVVANNLALLLVQLHPDDPATLARARKIAERFEGSSEGAYLDTLGWVQFRAGRVDQAVGNLEKAAQLLKPVPAELQYHLGMVYAQLGRTDEAKAQLTSAVEADTPFLGIDEARETLGKL